MRSAVGCKECRRRHQKCSFPKNATTCTRCRDNNRECARESAIRFRTVNKIQKPSRGARRGREVVDLGRHKTWIPVSGSIRFADDDPVDKGASPETTLPKETALTSALPSPEHSSLSSAVTGEATAVSLFSEQRSNTSKEGLEVQASPASSTTDFQNTSSSLSQQILSPHYPEASIYTENEVFPLKNRMEVQLLRHYTETLASWVDCCDRDRHFATVVPLRSSVCPVLLNAIFATSSRHLSALSNTSDDEATRYHEECLNILVPALSNPAHFLDENLLAAVVILRSFEEFSPDDAEHHLLGTTELLKASSSFASSGGLGEAASWIALRQDCYVALVRSRPLRVRLSDYEISASRQSDFEEHWANKAVLVAAKALEFAFGGGSPEQWDAIHAEADAWDVNKPWHFAPLYEEESSASSAACSEVIMLQDAHVVGFQHYHLAKMFLATYNPRLKFGFSMLRQRRASEKLALRHLRRIIALAVSDPDNDVGSFMVSHLLGTCGSWLEEPEERHVALAFLDRMYARMHFWRTAEAVRMLRQLWDMPESGQSRL